MYERGFFLFPPARQDSRFLTLEPKVQVSYFWRSWRAVGQLQPGSLRNEARPSICAVSVKFYVTHSRFYTTRARLNSLPRAHWALGTRGEIHALRSSDGRYDRAGS